MSAEDPFAAPAPYGPFAPPEDPFAARKESGGLGFDPFAPPTPLLPRSPKTADGKISPTITIQIEGDKEKIRDIGTFSLTDDVQQLADPWSCEIPNVDGKYDYLLERMWYPVTIWVSDPWVQDGREIQWLTGVIVDIEQTAGEQGTVVRLAGYDKGWYLSSGAPLWKNLRGISFGALFRKLLRPENNWDITAATSIYMNNRLRQGRSDAELAEARKQIAADRKAQEQALAQLQAAAGIAGQPVPTKAEMALQMTPPFFEKPPVIQTEPGQDCGSLLIRYAKIVGRLIGMSATGELQFFVPDYKQSPSYAFHNHRPNDERHSRNNVGPGWRLTLAGDQLYNVVECVVTRLVKDGTDLADETNPNEGKDIGKYRNLLTAGPSKSPPLRRLAFNDGEKWTLDQANERSKWKWKQSLYGSKTLTYPVMGISQPGPSGERRLYCAGTMAEVHDSWNGIERTMYVSRVQLDQGLHGTMATITLKTPDLLGA